MNYFQFGCFLLQEHRVESSGIQTNRNKKKTSSHHFNQLSSQWREINARRAESQSNLLLSNPPVMFPRRNGRSLPKENNGGRSRRGRGEYWQRWKTLINIISLFINAMYLYQNSSFAAFQFVKTRWQVLATGTSHMLTPINVRPANRYERANSPLPPPLLPPLSSPSPQLLYKRQNPLNKAKKETKRKRKWAAWWNNGLVPHSLPPPS